MFELLILAVFGWLFFKSVGLAFRATWGLGKVIAVCLFVLALPGLVGAFLLTGGVLLLIPVGLVVAAWFILRDCL